MKMLNLMKLSTFGGLFLANVASTTFPKVAPLSSAPPAVVKIELPDPAPAKCETDPTILDVGPFRGYTTNADIGYILSAPCLIKQFQYQDRTYSAAIHKEIKASSSSTGGLTRYKMIFTTTSTTTAGEMEKAGDVRFWLPSSRKNKNNNNLAVFHGILMKENFRGRGELTSIFFATWLQWAVDAKGVGETKVMWNKPLITKLLQKFGFRPENTEYTTMSELGIQVMGPLYLKKPQQSSSTSNQRVTIVPPMVKVVKPEKCSKMFGEEAAPVKDELRRMPFSDDEIRQQELKIEDEKDPQAEYSEIVLGIRYTVSKEESHKKLDAFWNKLKMEAAGSFRFLQVVPSLRSSDLMNINNKATDVVYDVSKKGIDSAEVSTDDEEGLGEDLRGVSFDSDISSDDEDEDSVMSFLPTKMQKREELAKYLELTRPRNSNFLAHYIE